MCVNIRQVLALIGVTTTSTMFSRCLPCNYGGLHSLLAGFDSALDKANIR